MKSFVADRKVTVDKVAAGLQEYVDFAANKLDYLAAFLETTTNDFEHTGTRSVVLRGHHPARPRKSSRQTGPWGGCPTCPTNLFAESSVSEATPCEHERHWPPQQCSRPASCSAGCGSPAD